MPTGPDSPIDPLKKNGFGLERCPVYDDTTLCAGGTDWSACAGDNTGVLCGQCTDGQVPGPDGLCMTCPQGAAAKVMLLYAGLIIAVAAFVGAAYYLLRNTERGRDIMEALVPSAEQQDAARATATQNAFDHVLALQRDCNAAAAAATNVADGGQVPEEKTAGQSPTIALDGDGMLLLYKALRLSGRTVHQQPSRWWCCQRGKKLQNGAVGPVDAGYLDHLPFIGGWPVVACIRAARVAANPQA